MEQSERNLARRELDFSKIWNNNNNNNDNDNNVLLPEHPQTQLQLKLLAQIQQKKEALFTSQSQTISMPVSQPSPQIQPQVPTPKVVQRFTPPPVPRPTLPLSKLESPKKRPRPNNEGKEVTPKKQKQCNCKNSRCLKLYCECFASGIYCEGCNCVNCHNNVDHEVARQVAIDVILERNPNAFRSKIVNSPHKSQDVREEAGELGILAKHNKGCHCKKSGCLKKYCECFQANILCSENCKCMDCKNFEGSEERRALFLGNNVAYLQQANAAIIGAIGSYGYETFPSSKRKIQEFIPANANPEIIKKIAQFEQDNHTKASSASSLFSAPVSCATNAMASGSSKLTYRSPLADILQHQDIKELCSHLVLVSGKITKTLADEQEKTDNQIEVDRNENSISSLAQHGENDIREDGVGNVVSDDRLGKNKADEDQIEDSESGRRNVLIGRPASPGTLALLCDENDIMSMEAGHPGHVQCSTHKSEVYADQERIILIKFWDFLTKLITCASIKETMRPPLTKAEVLASQQEVVNSGSVKVENDTSLVESNSNNIIESHIPASAQIPSAVNALAVVSSTSPSSPTKA